MRISTQTLERPPWPVSLTWALCMGGLFFLVYGGVNGFTATLTEVPSAHFDWEREIPFVQWMIVPYMSIDLLFVGAFFLCKDRQGLRILASRIGFAILVSAVCFVLFPLQFSFERPETDGIPGVLFSFLALDQPYNQCPSLHVSLGLILWQIYGTSIKGAGRYLIALWFVLIGASTLMVYQHHFVDLVGGALVAGLSVYAIPRNGSTLFNATPRHLRLSARYAGLVVICAGLASLLQGYAWLLLYPAWSCALVATAYATNNKGFLRKSGGRYSWSSKVLFAPHLVGVRCTWFYYARKGQAWSEVAPGLLIGRRLKDDEVEDLLNEGVTAVLDLAPELGESRRLERMTYQHVPMLDLVPADGKSLGSCLDFIESNLGRGKVYIHCSLGYFRCVAVAAAYLVTRGKQLDDALAVIRAKRDRVIGSRPLYRAVQAFNEERAGRVQIDSSYTPSQPSIEPCQASTT